LLCGGASLELPTPPLALFASPHSPLIAAVSLDRAVVASTAVVSYCRESDVLFYSEEAGRLLCYPASTLFDPDGHWFGVVHPQSSFRFVVFAAKHPTRESVYLFLRPGINGIFVVDFFPATVAVLTHATRGLLCLGTFCHAGEIRIITPDGDTAVVTVPQRALVPPSL
jgi:hypothetical protein